MAQKMAHPRRVWMIGFSWQFETVIPGKITKTFSGRGRQIAWLRKMTLNPLVVKFYWHLNGGLFAFWQGHLGSLNSYWKAETQESYSNASYLLPMFVVQVVVETNISDSGGTLLCLSNTHTLYSEICEYPGFLCCIIYACIKLWHRSVTHRAAENERRGVLTFRDDGWELVFH